MRAAERGFLLLASTLGDLRRPTLTATQLRILSERTRLLNPEQGQRELTESDLVSVGYGKEMARRILKLLSQEDVLDYYLQKGRAADCVPITRVTPGYPLGLRKGLGLESPACLWTKGDLSLLERPRVALVGSRDIRPENAAFARKVGEEAAKQGYVLVSGNARGADRIAQEACLAEGGRVICVIADGLEQKKRHPSVLYLSEETYDQPFSIQRALSRNRVIHALANVTMVAQCELEAGGTWQGTSLNLHYGWSPVRCFRDGSEAMTQLEQRGAELISMEQLEDLERLCGRNQSLFD